MKLQQLLSYTRRAVDDYQMIHEGDKIAVGISGGKDSLALLYSLAHLRIFYPKKFELEAVTVDLGFGNQDFAKIQPLKSWRYFTGSTDRMEFIMSEIAMMEFRDPKKDYEWVDYYSLLYAGDELPWPNIDFLRANYEMVLRWEDYSNASPPDYEPEVTEKEFKAKLMGTLEADLNDYQFSY